MPRAIWSGSVSFGLVSIPVKLHNAISRKSVSFNQLDSRTGARIRYRRVSAADGEEVASDLIVKGYELGKDNYVLVSDDEMAAIMPTAQRTIEIEEFVDLADIDPVVYDSAYHLVPEEATVKPYALLTEALEREGKVGIARFVMRSKQYVAAIRAQDGVLVMSTMVYADEVNDASQYEEIERAQDVEISDRELDMAAQLIESLSAEWEPEKYHDTYREQLLELIERKASGETDIAVQPPAAEEQRVVDLMAALEASVAEAKKARSGPSAADGDAPEPTGTADAETDTGADEASAADAPSKGGRKPAAKRAPAKSTASKSATAKGTASKTATGTEAGTKSSGRGKKADDERRSA